jgi:hypothetical protein
MKSHTAALLYQLKEKAAKRGRVWSLSGGLVKTGDFRLAELLPVAASHLRTAVDAMR